MLTTQLKPEVHSVVLDYAGASENIPRFTCYNEECDCATLVRQPYMNNALWNQKLDEFRQLHPFHKALSWAEYKSQMSMNQLINWMPGYEWIEDNEPDIEPENPEIQKPYCLVCGEEMEFDSNCWNCSFPI